MKKRFFALALALCLVFAMMPVPAFAEGEVADPPAGTAAPEETKKPEEPVVPEEGKKPEEPTALQKVQTLIDALPDTVTAENRAEAEAQLTAIDEAKALFGDEELADLDFAKYKASVAAINALDGTPGAEVPETLENETKNTLKFDTNGGTLETGAQPQIQTEEDAILISIGQIARKDDCEFVGWNTAQDGTGTSYNVQATYHFSAPNNGETVTLYAQWAPVKNKPEFRQELLNEYGIKITAIDENGTTIRENAEKFLSSAMLEGNDVEGYRITVTFTNHKEGLRKELSDKINAKLGAAGEWYFSSDDGTADVVLKWNREEGKWEPRENCPDNVLHTFTMAQHCTVAYTDGVDGEEVFSDQTGSVLGGEVAPGFAGTPIRANHVFTGWDPIPGIVIADTTYTAQWRSNAYTISFNANGGEGTMADLPMTYGQTEKLTANGFARTGYTFTGWNIQADGTGDSYADGQEVSNLTAEDGKTVTLYAQWQANPYTISFDANGGEETMADLSMAYDKAAKLPANGFARTGYTFTGWNAQADGTGDSYADEQEVSNLTAESGKALTLYAQWQAHTYTISFHANGGKGDMANLSMTYDKTAQLPANDFAREGYLFNGWTTHTDGTGLLFSEQEAVSNLTAADGETIPLYARWVKIIDRVNLTLSGHVFDKRVEQVKTATKDDISFLGEYDDGWGITRDPQKLTTLSAKLFQADTQYYLWVCFEAKEGFTLKGLTEKDVFLDGKAALSLTDEQGVVTVVFCLPVIYTVETSAGKNGTISPEGTVAVFEGEDVQIKITPNKGYVVYRLTVDGTNVKTARTYTFENLQESHVIKARFLKNGDNAKTGDSFPMATALGAVAFSAAAMAAALFIRKKKRAR